MTGGGAGVTFPRCEHATLLDSNQREGYLFIFGSPEQNTQSRFEDKLLGLSVKQVQLAAARAGRRVTWGGRGGGGGSHILLQRCTIFLPRLLT